MDNLEEMINSLEFAQMRNQIFSQLEQGNKMLQDLNAQMDVETVQKIMDDSREAIAYQKEISAAVAQVLTPEDDEAIEDQFNQMLAELLPQPISDPLPQPVAVGNPALPASPISEEEPILA